MAPATLRIRLLGELDLRLGEEPLPLLGSARAEPLLAYLRPHSSGLYVNFISDEGDAGVETAYGHRLKRLTALKDQYDPTNVFRMNANIPPSPPAGR